MTTKCCTILNSLSSAYINIKIIYCRGRTTDQLFYFWIIFYATLLIIHNVYTRSFQCYMLYILILLFMWRSDCQLAVLSVDIALISYLIFSLGLSSANTCVCLLWRCQFGSPIDSQFNLYLPFTLQYYMPTLSPTQIIRSLNCPLRCFDILPNFHSVFPVLIWIFILYIVSLLWAQVFYIINFKSELI